MIRCLAGERRRWKKGRISEMHIREGKDEEKEVIVTLCCRYMMTGLAEPA